MNRLAVGMAGAALAMGLGAYALSRVLSWRRKSPDELERLRRLDVHVEAGDPLPQVMAVYSYEVAGVSYEVGQDLAAFPHLASRTNALPGRAVSVKYDPKRPTNSIVTCEEWSGITQLSE